MNPENYGQTQAGTAPRPPLERIQFGRPDPTPGTCRYCGCTEQRACYDFHAPGDPFDLDDEGQGGTPQPCQWADDARTVCTVCARVGSQWPQTNAEAHELAALCQWQLWQFFAIRLGLVEPIGPTIDAGRCERLKARCTELAGPIPNRAVTLIIGS